MKSDLRNNEITDLSKMKIIPEISPEEMWNKFEETHNQKRVVSKWWFTSIAAVWVALMWMSIEKVQFNTQQESSLYEEFKVIDNTLYND